MRSISLALLGGAMLLAGTLQPATAQPQSSTPANPPPAQAAPPPAPAPTPANPPAEANPTAATPAPAAPPPAAPAPAAAAAGPVYVVTYFDVMPNNALKAVALLRQFAAATRKEAGNTEFTVLQEIARPGRFALVEAWKDKTAYDAHGAATKALADKLQPIFLAPLDARVFLPLATAGASSDADRTKSIFVLTHVDVFPAGKDEVTAMVKALAEDSRKDPGAQRIDAVVWDGHANHFHLIEAWSDRKSLEAHLAADHTKAFRAKLVPFEGALYDERFYDLVK
jgi:quinol monooxygenase YgiN